MSEEHIELTNKQKLELSIELARESFHLALEVIMDTQPPTNSVLRSGAIKIDSGWQLVEYASRDI